jgi:type II secretory pathway pseudopilin PulG
VPSPPDVAANTRRLRCLEILVAFVILALGLAGGLTGVFGAMRSDARRRPSRNALRVAQSRLEVAGVTSAGAGVSRGRVGSRYVWRQTVTAIQPVTDQATGGSSRDQLPAVP